MEPIPFQVRRDSVTLEGEFAGDGRPIVLLHGLSATRRNVVQGSRHLIKRGYRLIAYDARGHGTSSPAESYEYSELVSDLEAVLAHLGIGARCARGQFDGRRDGDGIRSRAPRPGSRARSDHARLHGLRANSGRGHGDLGEARLRARGRRRGRIRGGGAAGWDPRALAQGRARTSSSSSTSSRTTPSSASWPDSTTRRKTTTASGCPRDRSTGR